MGSWSLDISTERMIASDGCKQNFGRSISDQGQSRTQLQGRWHGVYDHCPLPDVEENITPAAE
jgi:hypothetical protein